jgi:DNA-binding transcriptional LysR family regulator
MELRDINAFLTVCEELHFTRAALRLRIAQSGVSQAIKRLEGELGVSLLARTKRRVALTEAGEAFRARSRVALRELAEAGVAARRTAAGLRGKLRVQFGFMATLTVVPAALARFKREYPEVELELEPAGTEPQLEALRLGRCDIGFMSFQHQLSGLTAEPVVRAPLVALLPTGHPLASRRRLPLAALSGEDFVFLNPASEPRVRLFFRERCLGAGFEPRVVMVSEQLEVLLALVAAGFGVSCLPALVRRVAFEGVVAIPLSPAILGGISVVWDATTLSPAGHNFLDILRKERANEVRR